MPWLELLVPALVLLLATPSLAIAYLYARSTPAAWCGSLLGFLTAASGVSLLTAVGIFLRAAAIGGTFALYFVIWNLSFLILAFASYFALATAHAAVGSRLRGRRLGLFAGLSAAAYAATLLVAIRGRNDLFFPYIGGIYAATSFYLFGSLGSALGVVLRGRARLSEENAATLGRFLRIFIPLGCVFLVDEALRSATPLRLPWLPLLPLAPLALYAFVDVELLRRLRERRPLAEPALGGSSPEELALAIAGACGASPLTTRERQLLVELLRGKSNAAIAGELNISTNTVKNHIYSIFQKCGAGSRKELFLFAARMRRAGTDS